MDKDSISSLGEASSSPGADMDKDSISSLGEASSSPEAAFEQEDSCETDTDEESQGEASPSTQVIKPVRGEDKRVSNRLPGRFSDYLDRSKLTLVTTIGPEEKFFRPDCIAATPSNDILVADLGRGVKIYDINGISTGKISIEEDAYDISATQDRLVVTGKTSHYVKVYKMDGQLDFQFSTEQHDQGEEAATGPMSACPYGVVVKKDGTIVVGSVSMVGDVKRMELTAHRSKDGKILHTIPVPIEPRLLAVDNDDRILVSDYRTILVVDGSSADSFIEPMIGGQAATSWGLCCTKSAVFVVITGDQTAGHLHQYDNKGKFVECVVKPLLLPHGITATADERYLAVIKANSVAIYNAEKDEENNVDAGHGSIFQGIGSLIMVSQTTTKTSQDSNDQRTQEPSHFQQVLDEVNMLTEDLSAIELLDRRIQLPYIAVGYFNEGGSLSLDEYGVHLTIPSGAIAPGSPQQVYIYVDPIAQPNDTADELEVVLSPRVQCGPEGLTFKESVVLSFPYHAVLTSQGCDKPDIQVRHEDSQERHLEDAKLALVTENMVSVLLDHFCKVSVVCKATPDISKRLKICAFGGPLYQLRLHYAFRVHVYEETDHEKVTQEENLMKSQMLDVPRNLVFFWHSGNLAVRVSDLVSEREWKIQGATEEIIDEKDIQNNSENSVTFNLKRQAMSPDNAQFYCVASAYQRSPTEDSRNKTAIRLKICPPKKKLSLWKKIARKVRRSRQQTPVSTSTENNNCCECERTGAFCGYCKETMGTGVSTIVHGDVKAEECGGLSSKAVYELCDHVDSSKNCQNLLERLTNKKGRSVEVATESARVRTTDVLKLYFDVCRRTHRTNEQAIHSLVDILKELNLERAVQIIQEDLDRRD